jgi:hypothetical protein
MEDRVLDRKTLWRRYRKQSRIGADKHHRISTGGRPLAEQLLTHECTRQLQRIKRPQTKRL